jgi:hypothetical protein
MDVEAQPEEVIWQAVVSARLKWAAEIEQRLNVKIEVMFSGYGHVFEHGEITGEATCVPAAKAEMLQCEGHIEQLHYSITLLRRDPIRRGVRYHESADLYGRMPWDAIKQAGLECIDVVLVGTAARAAAMLVEDPRLCAAAKTRALYAHDLDAWTPHVRNVLAQADVLRAAQAIEDAMNG